MRIIIFAAILAVGMPLWAENISDPFNLAHLPQLTPEKCALQAPDILLEKLLAENPKPAGIGGCEACTDYFYAIYGHQLAKKTNRDYPEVLKFRASLLDCFETCFRYIDAIHHHNGTNHLASRIPGELEWIIFRGFQQQSQNHYFSSVEFGDDDYLAHANGDDEAEYTPEQIEQLATAIGRANSSPDDHFETEKLPLLKLTLVKLAKAEETMTDDQTSFFRRYLVLFITRYP